MYKCKIFVYKNGKIQETNKHISMIRRNTFLVTTSMIEKSVVILVSAMYQSLLTPDWYKKVNDGTFKAIKYNQELKQLVEKEGLDVLRYDHRIKMLLDLYSLTSKKLKI